MIIPKELLVIGAWSNVVAFILAFIFLFFENFGIAITIMLYSAVVSLLLLINLKYSNSFTTLTTSKPNSKTSVLKFSSIKLCNCRLVFYSLLGFEVLPIKCTLYNLV